MVGQEERTYLLSWSFCVFLALCAPNKSGIGSAFGSSLGSFLILLL